MKLSSRSAACPLFLFRKPKREGESKVMQHQDTVLMDDEPVVTMSPEGNLQLLADTALQAMQAIQDSYEHNNDWQNDIRACRRVVRDYKQWVKLLEEENARALSEIQRLKKKYNDPDATPPNSPSRADATRSRLNPILPRDFPRDWSAYAGLNPMPLDWSAYVSLERAKKRRLS